MPSSGVASSSVGLPTISPCKMESKQHPGRRIVSRLQGSSSFVLFTFWFSIAKTWDGGTLFHLYCCAGLRCRLLSGVCFANVFVEAQDGHYSPSFADVEFFEWNTLPLSVQVKDSNRDAFKEKRHFENPKV